MSVGGATVSPSLHIHYHNNKKAAAGMLKGLKKGGFFLGGGELLTLKVARRNTMLWGNP